jgi:hypothetical protein
VGLALRIPSYQRDYLRILHLPVGLMVAHKGPIEVDLLLEYVGQVPVMVHERTPKIRGFLVPAAFHQAQWG